MTLETTSREATPPRPAAATRASDDVTVRRVASLAEYQACVDLQFTTWGPGFRELVTPAVMMVAQKLGGVCAGAFKPDGQLVGLVFGMTGVYGGELAHWSDLLAVHPEARGHGIGERLKRHQRELVRAIGVRTMYWTFDPLVARNAHLNLVRLGARAMQYVPNMYGENTGSPLHGVLATDRLVARWDLDGGLESASGATAPGTLVTPLTHDGLPGLDGLPDAAAVRIAVPRDLAALEHDERVRWRDVTRQAFLTYLERGYRVMGFDRGDERRPPTYSLERSSGD